MRRVLISLAIVASLVALALANAEFPEYLKELQQQYPELGQREFEGLHALHNKETEILQRAIRNYDTCSAQSSVASCALKMFMEYSFANGFEEFEKEARNRRLDDPLDKLRELVSTAIQSVMPRFEYFVYAFSRSIRLALCGIHNMLGSGFQMTGDAVSCVAHDLVHNKMVDLWVFYRANHGEASPFIGKS
eukprot:Nk52_evm34s2325 gene=Nk52_evmTU34s2325